MVQSFIDRDQHIWRSNQITEKVRLDYDVNITDAFASSIMRSNFGMRYKRVQLVAFTGNSE